ncbi:hypothetical protein PAXRUDRAFT_18578 [Paxillus rubicundulus Ve08.2h10]|uniref:Uncharacterized protein n=1 Tax=Paxillus rubicundulus Ve08.2h10 TaxID=930991 RepID=A0A0D0DEH2_9AGAM|nr:hypothetical protein PAXRUDRAFT_18578 [Paxillus rubicundulus Ve08.2h10]
MDLSPQSRPDLSKRTQHLKCGPDVSKVDPTSQTDPPFWSCLCIVSTAHAFSTPPACFQYTPVLFTQTGP